MLHDIVTFLEGWAPYIWLFGSIFGVIMSGVLLKQAYEQKVVSRTSNREAVVAFWLRHSAYFFLLHFGYVIVGFLSVAKIDNDWTSLIIITILVSTPLILVYRSYDSLRLNASQRRQNEQ